GMRTPQDDAYLGRTVLERQLVPREALLECLFQMAQDRKAGVPRPLGVVLVSRGLLTQDDLNGLLAGPVGAAGAAGGLPEAEVGRLLVASGLISRDNVEECVRLQEEMRRSGRQAPALGELVVHRGYVTEGQVVRALAYQQKIVFQCAGCSVRVTAAPPPPGSRYRCKKCGGLLVQVDAPASPGAGGSIALREGARGEDTQLEIDRAAAAYLKQKNLVRRDQLREGQRLQMEFARYGLVVPLLELMRRLGAISIQQQQDIEAMDLGRLVRDPGWKMQAVPGYRLLARVASGGFAAIWTAEPAFGGGRVAVKVLHPERARDPRSVARFEWEAMLLRRFNCPRIVRGLDHGFERGNHYLVMEFIEGRSLGQVLSESGALPLLEALRLTRQVAEALQYLHGQGYLHRDVKPDNVLVDGLGHAKLCDLGFAIPVPKAGAEVTMATAVGTQGYMPPESRAGREGATVGGDIYSLGIHLYALLTGHEPYPGASSEEVVTDQIEGGMPVPNLMVVNAPPSVIQLLKKMMHPDPVRRFGRVEEVIAALDRLSMA
ncbi:MAG TPA: protein kinase, partial [Planctomycetota bacterium]|nr:protein kinase [Planctomycetota bacterium]